LARRALAVLPVLFGVSVLTFAMLHLIPGDPAAILGGAQATEDELAGIRRDHGLDRPLAVQYARYLGRLLRGDLGVSIRTRDPVAGLLLGGMGLTLALAALSIVLAVGLGVAAGVLAAVRPNSVIDVLTMLGALVGVSMPVFWYGLILLFVFAGTLRWLPAGGVGGFQHLVLPVVVLGTAGMGVIARLTRAAMLEVLGQEYVRTARAKGLAEWRVVLRHGLWNALNPVLTVVGLQFGFLLGGSVLTETVFALPGIGRIMVTAIFSRDYPVVQGGMLLVAAVFVLVNLLTDVAYAVVNPRLRI
jgi:peptide/nickel transport system permease protein/oligopeptide transport system permease protein